MATTGHQPAKTQQMIKRDRRISTSEDAAMLKQIQATHSPDGLEVDVKPLLTVIDEILRRATLPDITGVINLACRCSSGADAHSTTLAILNLVSSQKWEAKLVTSLAAFAVNYGEFWLIAQLYATNPLAKAIALLKQLPDILVHSNSLKSRFDAITNLLKAILDVTKCVVEFNELPSQYISDETPPMSAAIALIPTAAYWTIRSMVACASQITSLLGMSYEHMTATAEAWELSSLAHKVRNMHGHLMAQLALCHQHIGEPFELLEVYERKHDDYFRMLVHLFETPHLDNLKILKVLINSKDDPLPLVDGTTKTRVGIEVLSRKIVLLLISDLDLSPEELIILPNIYQEARQRTDTHYEVVWIPVVERSMPWNEGTKQKFQHLQSLMPWYTVHDPLAIEPAVTKYIKEGWHFQKKMLLVVLDPQGKVACRNAFHMIWIWRNLAHPFTTAKEEALWKEETWTLELLVDGIDPNILDWISQGKFICLYGGEDIEWIRRFTTLAKSVAQTAGISLEMVYVGRSSSREKVRKIVETITREQLSHTWLDLTSIWYFWARLESMLHSKMQHGKMVENDPVMQEIMTMLSFDGSDGGGWALISRGTAELGRSKGDTVERSLKEFPEWEQESKQIGFVPALVDHLHKLHTPEHCSRLILPGISGGIPEMVVCAECGRPMEKFFMYRCCTD
ncbi:hypothetical protein RJ639_008774 [Escallonia herrerae]|uniref:Protein SIEVE ELEMENT OCCLUSION B-like n=1 Tax=Escallonia herrerae TaxID=1293975 RepID=A0AA88VTT0_9ASTE|nr:hypothetical protein RJ639_008774 [Escallonia herrerae]